MQKFQVSLTRTCYKDLIFEVEAEDEDHARELIHDDMDTAIALDAAFAAATLTEAETEIDWIEPDPDTCDVPNCETHRQGK